MIPEQTFTILAELADSVDARSGNAGHCKRVASYTADMLKVMGVEGRDALLIEQAARLHDIGKLGIPEELLTKPGNLSLEEWQVMRTHPQRGADYLANTDATRAVGAIVLSHHERTDGSGYPRKLRGEAIPLGARIIAVADGFDTMTHDQPYRKGQYIARSMAVLAQEAGRQWDRAVVAAFLSEALPSLIRFGRLQVPAELVIEGISA